MEPFLSVLSFRSSHPDLPTHDMPRSRWWKTLFALVHGLATIVAFWPHDHRAHSGRELQPLAGCNDPTPHFAGHADADPAGASLDCPFCSHRSVDQAVELGRNAVDVPVTAQLEVFETPSTDPARHDPSQPRAPPLV